MGRVGRAVRGAASTTGRTAVGYWRGVTFPFRGAVFVYLRHPALVRYWAVPILLTLAALVLAVVGTVRWHDELVAWVWTEPTGEGFWAGLLRFLHGFVEVVGGIVMFGLSVLALIPLSKILAAPFNDALSEEVERLSTGRSGPRFSVGRLAVEAVRTVSLELAKLGLQLAVLGPLFVLALLVPPLGPVSFAAGLVFSSLYHGIDYVDWPLGRRGFGLRARARFARGHAAPLFGFGTGVWALLYVPFLNLFFMPAAVAGGTLLVLELEASGGLRGGPELPAARSDAGSRDGLARGDGAPPAGAPPP